MDNRNLPPEKWTESDVKEWLTSIGLKEVYIQKLYEEELTGSALKGLAAKYLHEEIGMKSAQIQLLLQERDELLKCSQKQQKTQRTIHDSGDVKSNAIASEEQGNEKPCPENIKKVLPAADERKQQPVTKDEPSNLSRFHPFAAEHSIDFKYVKHTVLQPETGIVDLIIPCHEYKSLDKASQLDRTRLQVKFASEVIRFACGCMNMRSNGTIHFGVMDSKDKKYKHGEIIGIPVKDPDYFVDALDYIEKCFPDTSQQKDARQCIWPPRFVEVIHRDSSEKAWVIEVDIVPLADVVKGKLYNVRIPKFNEKTNKIEYDKTANYQRVGTSTSTMKDDLVSFIQGMQERDLMRKISESVGNQAPSKNQENLGRKLCVLLTCGKKFMDDSLWYIIVTDKFEEENLKNISFLHQMNIFCVLDFDPDSLKSGLCGKYREKRGASLHSLENYSKDDRQNQTSWIFCNGRNDYLGGETPCDEKTWIKSKKKYLKKTVSMICNEILPKGSFVVLFLLMSQVDQPLVDTFHEFYAEMNGHEDMCIISVSKENYIKWSNLAQASCSLETLQQISIMEMPMSHVDATIQSIQLSASQPTRNLPVSNKGCCFLRPVDEDNLNSLEILSLNQCDEINLAHIDKEQAENTERDFYRGGKIHWMMLWLAEKKLCGEVIQRDAYGEADKILEEITQCNPSNKSVAKINIYHHPGSGGSTVARQILWNWKRKLRCAVVRQSYPAETVCNHTVQLQEYEETDKNSCLPVLLLLEDSNKEYLDELVHELINAIATVKIRPSTPCFVILNCKRSNDPEKMCKMLPLQTVAVTHRLSQNEKFLFARKREALDQYKPEFILTFVLMTDGFEQTYIKNFVENILLGIDHSSLVTRLIRFVALLNTYIQNSYMSVSHCEASLGMGIQMDRVLYHNFENSLSEQAKLVFIHLKDSTTHISCIRIIHPLIAKEILQQVSGTHPRSSIAMDLIQDKLLLNHKFGKDPFLKFVRDLFRRYKISKGDGIDSFLPPLIEDVCTEEGHQKASDLLKTAFMCFGKDPFLAQQLARLLYTNKQFEEAKDWAEVAKAILPCDSFICDTEGQVYKKWFYDMYDAFEDEPTPENVSEIIAKALQGIYAFRASQKVSKLDPNNMNNSSFLGEVDIGCRLLKLLSSVNLFSDKKDGRSELFRYLLTDYIPEPIGKPWKAFHSQLKDLQKSIHDTLEWISEYLTYFNIEISEEEEVDISVTEQVLNPRKWLMKRSSEYAKFFCDAPSDSPDLEPESSTADMLSPLKRKMKIYQRGGGTVSSILSLLSDHKIERAGRKLEEIIELYPEDFQAGQLDQTELVNYILTQIVLSCVLPHSPKLVSLSQLKELSKPFHKERNNMSPASAHFLVSLLFWPDDPPSKQPIQGENKILTNAIETLHRLHDIKIKNVPIRKIRTSTHFFLGKERGLNKYVHKSQIQRHIKGTFTERNLKWRDGEVWKTPEVAQLLKRMEGWTQNGKLYTGDSSKGNKIRVTPLSSTFLPNGDENVTFYLGFSFDAMVAFDIRVKNN